MQGLSIDFKGECPYTLPFGIFLHHFEGQFSIYEKQFSETCNIADTSIKYVTASNINFFL